MEQLKAQAPHLVMALAVIGAVAALAVAGVITGGEALSTISLAAGVSLGGAVSSLSPSGTTATVPVTVPVHVTAKQTESPSSSTQTSDGNAATQQSNVTVLSGQTPSVDVSAPNA